MKSAPVPPHTSSSPSNLFDVKLFSGEGRVTIKEAAGPGYDNAELPLSEFLAAIFRRPSGARMPGAAATCDRQALRMRAAVDSRGAGVRR
jgi:hypothetical protein